MDAIRNIEDRITPDEVYEEEAKTHHNVRAVVNVMKRKVPREIAPLVHLGATSVDMLDTAASIRYRNAVRTVILPLLLSLEEGLIDLAQRHAETPQIGRTHGQHAVPTTFGFALSEYVARLGSAIQQIDARSTALRGKLSGAIGGYNATTVVTADPIGLEAELMDHLGLTPAEHATQIVPPEPLLRLLLEINMAFGIIANLADDLRNLQRSEIAEVQRGFRFLTSGLVDHAAETKSLELRARQEPLEGLRSAGAELLPGPDLRASARPDELRERPLCRRVHCRLRRRDRAHAPRCRRAARRCRPHACQHCQHSDATLAEAVYIALALAGDSDAHEYDPSPHTQRRWSAA